MIYIYIKILRGNNKENSHYQRFEYNGDMNLSIALVLNELNSREKLCDINNNEVDKIDWECGCLQNKCGACSMIINGKPKLACTTFLNEVIDKNNTVTLEPFKKFPLISDLIVDKSSIFENMKEMALWLEGPSEINLKESEGQYQSAQCLMCMCCLEICPNFHINSDFYGSLTMVNYYKLLIQNSKGEHRDNLIKKYKGHYYGDCGKSLSCGDICPLKLDIEELLVKSNAMTIRGKDL